MPILSAQSRTSSKASHFERVAVLLGSLQWISEYEDLGVKTLHGAGSSVSIKRLHHSWFEIGEVPFTGHSWTTLEEELTGLRAGTMSWENASCFQAGWDREATPHDIPSHAGPEMLQCSMGQPQVGVEAGLHRNICGACQEKRDMVPITGWQAN